MISIFDRLTSFWIFDKANYLGDKDLLHMIRGSDNKCSDMMADCFQYHISLHEFLPHKAWSFTGDGMTKYPHRPMCCCNDAVDIMPR